MAQQALGDGVDGAAAACPVRAARRGRLGLGLGQGVRLADHHHLHARLPAGPRLLPDGRPDRGPRACSSGRRSTSARRPTRRCPARRRSAAVVPWQPSPAELSLPQPRTDGAALQVGTKILYIGGTDGKTAQSTVYVARTVGTGNFDAWAEGPPLPAPRADASVATWPGASTSSVARDASGAPTDTVFVLTPGRPDRRARRVERRAGRAQAARAARGAPRPRSRRTGCC